MDFKDRVAIVTGGTGALGTAVVKDLLARGARVAVAYRSDADWKMLLKSAEDKEDQILGVRVDLTHATEVEGFEREVRSLWGHVEFLVAAAGGFAPGKSYTTEDQAWEHMLNLNFRSLVNSLRVVVPIMIQQNFGRIVTVSTGSILHGGGAGMAAYAIAKGAVRQLSEILAEEVKNYNIHVHCLMPGTMDTPANRQAMPNADFSKWVKTEDVARVVHFLLSDEARPVRSVVVPVLG